MEHQGPRSVGAAPAGGLRICDAHQHLWSYPDSLYLAEQLQQDVGALPVVATIAVEAWPRNLRDGGGLRQPWEETARAVAEGRGNPGRTRIAAGIVGYADLGQGAAVEAVLEAHLRAGQGRLRGIRPSGDSDLADRHFLEGCAAVAQRGLSLDLSARGERMRGAAEVAARHPHTPVILNHLGLTPAFPPPQGEQALARCHRWEPWARLIDEVAQQPNLYMKLGGLGMDLVSAGWTAPRAPDARELAELMRPWYRYCIARFGARRCMLESNFPVDRRAFAYGDYWDAAQLVTEDLSDLERYWLFYGTAALAYRI